MLITAAQALTWIRQGPVAALDVRAEDEYAKGHVPGFLNAPILNQEERPQVGRRYKVAGQAAALDLGLELVSPHKEERVASWLAAAGGLPFVVACWRGGLRSSFATDWLQAAGATVHRVDGGYKALRRELLQVLAAPPPLVILTGFTGSGKTALLTALNGVRKVDLEGLAQHSGSAFGARWGSVQPPQASFENAIGLQLMGADRPVLLEDESLLIGGLSLPVSLMTAMQQSPRIMVEVPLAERAAHIYEEYVAAPLAGGINPKDLEQQLSASLHKLTRRLGGAMTAAVAAELQAAFASSEAGPEPHRAWISMLLSSHYDRCYEYGSQRHTGPLIFRGSPQECQQWILTHYASPPP